MPSRNMSIMFAVIVFSLLCYSKAPKTQEARTLSQALEIIAGNYVAPIESRQLFEDAMEGMVSGLDPYSTYIPPEQYLRFQESLDQQFGGIGIIVDGPPREERLLVVSPLLNTPAYRAGVQAADVILRIDDLDTTGLKLADAVKQMRGKLGSKVELTLQRQGVEKPLVVSMKRAQIMTESVMGDTRQDSGAWEFYLEHAPQIGYIRINSFGERTVEELKVALDYSSHSIDALIIDLRENAGGLLTAAVEVCDMFLDEGRIVRTLGRGKRVLREHLATPGVLVDAGIPVAILVDRLTASASEIVAACLKDHGRATLIGQRTWGKGSVQNVIEMEGGRSALKLTTATYWRPSEKNIHRSKKDWDEFDEDDWGVRPSAGFQCALTEDQFKQVAQMRRDRDIVRPLVVGDAGNDHAETAVGEESEENDEIVDPSNGDPQLKKALEYIAGKISEQGSQPEK